MLRTNSKKARENVRVYILGHFDPNGYDTWAGSAEDFPNVARFILTTCAEEKRYAGFGDGFSGFLDWAQGLPSILDTCYFYNRSAVDDLAVILEETPEEAKRYAESDAERLLTLMIWRELEKGATK